MDMPLPSEVGIKKYPPIGYYTANRVGDDDFGTPCTCNPECHHDCKGWCGCWACCEAYGDFLSSQGD